MKKGIVITSNLLAEWSMFNKIFGSFVMLEITCISLEVAMNNFTIVCVDMILVDLNLPDIANLDDFNYCVKKLNPEITIVEYDLRKSIVNLHLTHSAKSHACLNDFITSVLIDD